MSCSQSTILDTFHFKNGNDKVSLKHNVEFCFKCKIRTSILKDLYL